MLSFLTILVTISVKLLFLYLRKYFEDSALRLRVPMMSNGYRNVGMLQSNFNGIKSIYEDYRTFAEEHTFPVPD